MTVGEFTAHATADFTESGIESARLDSLILLEDELGMDRARLLAHPELPISAAQLLKLNKKCVQRMAHVPLAYIRGKVAFYGHEFTVTSSVLIPRPETESMIDIVHTIKDLTAKPRIADLGTGSGCIGITVALQLPAAEVFLFDIDTPALVVARQNATALGATVHTDTRNLLANDTASYDVILTNLPYVPEKYPINRAAGHEPALALFAGPDGLNLYRDLWAQLTVRSQKPPHVITESLLEQHNALADLAMRAGYTLVQTKGLAQHFCPQGLLSV